MFSGQLFRSDRISRRVSNDQWSNCFKVCVFWDRSKIVHLDLDLDGWHFWDILEIFETWSAFHSLFVGSKSLCGLVLVWKDHIRILKFLSLRRHTDNPPRYPDISAIVHTWWPRPASWLRRQGLMRNVPVSHRPLDWQLLTGYKQYFIISLFLFVSTNSPVFPVSVGNS